MPQSSEYARWSVVIVLLAVVALMHIYDYAHDLFERESDGYA